MRNFARLAFLAITCGSAVCSVQAQQDNGDSRPAVTFTVGDQFEGQVRDGPLFQATLQALEAASDGDGAGFADYISDEASLTLDQFRDGELVETPLTVEMIRAAGESCLGPYPYHEGATWAQLSWICRVDPESSLTAFKTFRDSPELGLTVWFEGDKIRKIVAMEPIPVPGRRRISMNAYQLMGGGND